mmetsp:Transcript_5144/g.6224  ORF Transcript_5144/g.6224 Transcript_5144/m.6224 type:complete len:188 (-) Transcript_5144:11-574(-)
MASTSVFNNASKEEKCYELPDDDSFDGIWDFQYCTQLLPQETYFSMTGIKDMFFHRPINNEMISSHCRSKFGITPRYTWMTTSYESMFTPSHSNSGQEQDPLASSIVFTNGGYDPWSFGGVYLNSTAKDIFSLTIPEGAHHLDLFFSHPKDPESVKRVRQFQLSKVRQWARIDLHQGKGNEFYEVNQ